MYSKQLMITKICIRVSKLATTKSLNSCLNSSEDFYDIDFLLIINLFMDFFLNSTGQHLFQDALSEVIRNRKS